LAAPRKEYLAYDLSFEECLHCAALNGGDRDTLGAMACAISGAYLGYEAIPKSWLDKIENRECLEHVASRLFMMMKGHYH